MRTRDPSQVWLPFPSDVPTEIAFENAPGDQCFVSSYATTTVVSAQA